MGAPFFNNIKGEIKIENLKTYTKRTIALILAIVTFITVINVPLISFAWSDNETQIVDADLMYPKGTLDNLELNIQTLPDVKITGGNTNVFLLTERTEKVAHGGVSQTKDETKLDKYWNEKKDGNYWVDWHGNYNKNIYKLTDKAEKGDWYTKENTDVYYSAEGDSIRYSPTYSGSRRHCKYVRITEKFEQDGSHNDHWKNTYHDLGNTKITATFKNAGVFNDNQDVASELRGKSVDMIVSYDNLHVYGDGDGDGKLDREPMITWTAFGKPTDQTSSNEWMISGFSSLRISVQFVDSEKHEPIPTVNEYITMYSLDDQEAVAVERSDRNSDGLSIASDCYLFGSNGDPAQPQPQSQTTNYSSWVTYTPTFNVFRNVYYGDKIKYPANRNGKLIYEDRTHPRTAAAFRFHPYDKEKNITTNIGEQKKPISFYMLRTNVKSGFSWGYHLNFTPLTATNPNSPTITATTYENDDSTRLTPQSDKNGNLTYLGYPIHYEIKQDMPMTFADKMSGYQQGDRIFVLNNISFKINMTNDDRSYNETTDKAGSLINPRNFKITLIDELNTEKLLKNETDYTIKIDGRFITIVLTKNGLDKIRCKGEKIKIEFVADSNHKYEEFSTVDCGIKTYINQFQSSKTTSSVPVGHKINFSCSQGDKTSEMIVEDGYKIVENTPAYKEFNTNHEHNELMFDTWDINGEKVTKEDLSGRIINQDTNFVKNYKNDENIITVNAYLRNDGKDEKLPGGLFDWSCELYNSNQQLLNKDISKNNPKVFHQLSLNELYKLKVAPPTNEEWRIVEVKVNNTKQSVDNNKNTTINNVKIPSVVDVYFSAGEEPAPMGDLTVHAIDTNTGNDFNGPDWNCVVDEYNKNSENKGTAIKVFKNLLVDDTHTCKITAPNGYVIDRIIVDKKETLVFDKSYTVNNIKVPKEIKVYLSKEKIKNEIDVIVNGLNGDDNKINIRINSSSAKKVEDNNDYIKYASGKLDINRNHSINVNLKDYIITNVMIDGDTIVKNGSLNNWSKNDIKLHQEKDSPTIVEITVDTPKQVRFECSCGEEIGTITHGLHEHTSVNEISALKDTLDNHMKKYHKGYTLESSYWEQKTIDENTLSKIDYLEKVEYPMEQLSDVYVAKIVDENSYIKVKAHLSIGLIDMQYPSIKGYSDWKCELYSGTELVEKNNTEQRTKNFKGLSKDKTYNLNIGVSKQFPYELCIKKIKINNVKQKFEGNKETTLNNLKPASVVDVYFTKDDTPNIENFELTVNAIDGDTGENYQGYAWDCIVDNDKTIHSIDTEQYKKQFKKLEKGKNHDCTITAPVGYFIEKIQVGNKTKEVYDTSVKVDNIKDTTTINVYFRSSTDAVVNVIAHGVNKNDYNQVNNSLVSVGEESGEIFKTRKFDDKNSTVIDTYNSLNILSAYKLLSSRPNYSISRIEINGKEIPLDKVGGPMVDGAKPMALLEFTIKDKETNIDIYYKGNSVINDLNVTSTGLKTADRQKWKSTVKNKSTHKNIDNTETLKQDGSTRIYKALDSSENYEVNVIAPNGYVIANITIDGVQQSIKNNTTSFSKSISVSNKTNTPTKIIVNFKSTIADLTVNAYFDGVANDSITWDCKVIESMFKSHKDNTAKSTKIFKDLDKNKKYDCEINAPKGYVINKIIVDNKENNINKSKHKVDNINVPNTISVYFTKEIIKNDLNITIKGVEKNDGDRVSVTVDKNAMKNNSISSDMKYSKKDIVANSNPTIDVNIDGYKIRDIQINANNTLSGQGTSKLKGTVNIPNEKNHTVNLVINVDKIYTVTYKDSITKDIIEEFPGIKGDEIVVPGNIPKHDGYTFVEYDNHTRPGDKDTIEGNDTIYTVYHVINDLDITSTGLKEADKKKWTSSVTDSSHLIIGYAETENGSKRTYSKLDSTKKYDVVITAPDGYVIESIDVDGKTIDNYNKGNWQERITISSKVNTPSKIKVHFKEYEVPDLNVSFVKPNAGYRFGTEVISTFTVTNNSNIEYTDTSPLKATFTAEINKNEIITVTKEVVVPANKQNIFYFKWKMPEKTNYPKDDYQVEVHVKLEDNKSCTVKATAEVAAVSNEDFEIEPDGYNLDGGKDFHPTQAKKDNKEYYNQVKWEEYVCENGVFTKKTYSANVGFNTIKLTPDKDNPSYGVKDKLYVTRSGYGVSLNAIGETKSSTDISTMPQYGQVYYPEKGFKAINPNNTNDGKTNNFETLESRPGTIPARTEFYFRELENKKNRHFVPLWYPNTPAGNPKAG